MIDVIKAAILGVIEGLTEFLPISSTGHMILAEPLLRIDKDAPPWQAFLYFIQIGAILAVIVYFWRRLWRELFRWPAARPRTTAEAGAGGGPPLLRKPRGVKGFFDRLSSRPIANHLATKLLVAFLPAAIVGLALHKTLEKHLEKPVPIAVALIVGAVAMEWIERGHRKGATVSVEDVSLGQALAIGVAQCISIIPGTSRAMATIMGGMLVGLQPATAAVFSFYLAIPTLIAAGGFSLFKHRHELHRNEATLLGVGFATAFVVALLVVEGFMRYVQTRRLRPFAIYRVLLGSVVLAWWFAAGRHVAG